MNIPMWPLASITWHLLYDSQGRYEQAEPLYQQALEMRKRLLGDEHPDVAYSSLNNLAESLSLNMKQKLRYPEIADSLYCPKIYIFQGRYEEAEPLCKRCLRNDCLLGNQHPNVASSLDNLAVLYANAKPLYDAEPLF
jgi:tetratricopeptide (TPR) repeat protein